MKKFILPIILSILGMSLLGLSFMQKSANGNVDVDIVRTNTIMPAAHNVYSNPEALEGKYFLFKSKITNNTNSVLEDVTVKYRVPGYID